MLSYVGGLFSLIFVAIAFFIGSYSEYKYELSVAESLFLMDERGDKVRDRDFGFFSFLKYALYDWMDSLGCKVSWHEMERIHRAREEATEQMDVRYLIKKIERFEHVNGLLLKERNLICTNLSQPPTLDRIRKMRKITQYYDKVIKE